MYPAMWPPLTYPRRLWCVPTMLCMPAALRHYTATSYSVPLIRSSREFAGLARVAYQTSFTPRSFSGNIVKENSQCVMEAIVR
ncbi:hypothetical protein F5Y18DRAFT_383051 [Xylariaceae sp. FL1019]|nr:hypothetical protein F5Y18DRAFT_383051 [Xylariaceae sp. FL1019]